MALVAGGGLMVVSMAGHGHKQACEQAMEEEEGRQAKLGLICLAGPSFPPFVPSLLPLPLPPLHFPFCSRLVLQRHPLSDPPPELWLLLCVLG